MNSTMFTLNTRDFVKGLALVVIVSVLGILQQMLTAHGFDFGSYDWGTISKVAVTAGIGYVLKNYLSDQNGKVLGHIG